MEILTLESFYKCRKKYIFFSVFVIILLHLDQHSALNFHISALLQDWSLPHTVYSDPKAQCLRYSLSPLTCLDIFSKLLMIKCGWVLSKYHLLTKTKQQKKTHKNNKQTNIFSSIWNYFVASCLYVFQINLLMEILVEPWSLGKICDILSRWISILK